MKESPQKRAARRRKRRSEWYAAQYPVLGELPSDAFTAAIFPLLQAEMKATLKRNNALLRRLKKRGAR